MLSNKNKPKIGFLGGFKRGVFALSLGVALTLSPTQSKAFDLTSVTGGSASDIVSSVTGGLDLNGIIDQLLSSLGDFDGGISDIFNDFDIGGITDMIDSANELLGCLGSDSLDLGSITDNVSGLCSLGGLGDLGGGSIDLSMLSCLSGSSGGDTNPLDQINDLSGKLSSMCGNAVGGGSTGGGSTGGGGLPSGGSFQTPVDYGATMASVSTATEMVGLGVGSKVDGNDIGNAPTPSGDKLSVIDGDDGGVIIKQLEAKPNSSTAKAYRDMDKYTLTLQRLVALNVASSDLSQKLDISKYALPATPLDVKKQEADLVNLTAGFNIDLNALQNAIVDGVRPLYTSINTDTLNDYYVQERKKFQEYVTGDFAKTLETIRLGAYKTIEARYALKLFNMVSDKDYMFDISNQRLSRISPDVRSKFIVKAIIQMNKEVEIKTQMALEKDAIQEAISRTVERAYPASSVFRGDIAKKEIDELLKAVDNAIQ